MTDNLLRASILKQFCLLDIDTVIEGIEYKRNNNCVPEETTSDLDDINLKYYLTGVAEWITISLSLHISLRNI